MVYLILLASTLSGFGLGFRLAVPAIGAASLAAIAVALVYAALEGLSTVGSVILIVGTVTGLQFGYLAAVFFRNRR